MFTVDPNLFLIHDMSVDGFQNVQRKFQEATLKVVTVWCSKI